MRPVSFRFVSFPDSVQGFITFPQNLGALVVSRRACVAILTGLRGRAYKPISERDAIDDASSVLIISLKE